MYHQAIPDQAYQTRLVYLYDTNSDDVIPNCECPYIHTSPVKYLQLHQLQMSVLHHTVIFHS